MKHYIRTQYKRMCTTQNASGGMKEIEKRLFKASRKEREMNAVYTQYAKVYNVCQGRKRPRSDILRELRATIKNYYSQ